MVAEKKVMGGRKRSKIEIFELHHLGMVPYKKKSKLRAGVSAIDETFLFRQLFFKKTHFFHKEAFFYLDFL